MNYVTNRVTDDDPKGDLFGIGAYGRYQVTPAGAVAVRYERVDDDGGLFGGIDQLLQEITVTGDTSSRMDFSSARSSATTGRTRRSS